MEAVSTRVLVCVAPGAAHAGVIGRHGEAWKVRVTPPPEGGRANEAVLRLLAEALVVPRNAVLLASGHGSRNKLVELTGIDPSQIEQRLSAAAERVRA
jgi:uncharacterized protein YggU (UPF0235/DUF167 family)